MSPGRVRSWALFIGIVTVAGSLPVAADSPAPDPKPVKTLRVVAPRPTPRVMAAAPDTVRVLDGDGIPLSPARRLAPTPLMRQIADIETLRDAALEKLRVQLRATSDLAARRALQREASRVKRDAEIAMLRAQIVEASAKGRVEAAEGLRRAAEALEKKLSAVNPGGPGSQGRKAAP